MRKADLTDQKENLRKKIKKLRDSLSIDEVESKSRIIESRLCHFITDRNFKNIMFYIAFGSEVRMQDSITYMLAEGRVVIVPVCITRLSCSKERDILPSRLFDLKTEVQAGRFGVPEPKPEFLRPFPPKDIDLVAVPGIAFDKKGYRLGFGAGYYDRFLPKCLKAVFVGLAYEMQIVEDTFPAEWDIPVHKIITEDRMISCFI